MSVNNQKEIIVLGGGCFWCTEAIFKMMKGVESVLPGYAGGTTENPTDEEVYRGTTGHAEVVQIAYDKEVVGVRDLLTVFFGSHDPTTLNRQGADVGTQYRSAIFYTTESQKQIALQMIDEINNSNEDGARVTTEVIELERFFEAENYHHDYFAQNKEAMYCQVVINPKLKKVQEQFANLIKKQ